MCHPVLWAVQVRAAGPRAGASSSSSPLLSAVDAQVRNPQGHFPAAYHSHSHSHSPSPDRVWGSFTAPLPSSPSPGKDSALLTSPRPSLPSSPQVLLLGAPPRAGSAGHSRAEQHLHHLPGPRGGQEVLPHHGVPSMPTRLVPPELHPEAGCPRWRLLPLLALPKRRSVCDGNAHHGDSNLQEVGFALPS